MNLSGFLKLGYMVGLINCYKRLVGLGLRKNQDFFNRYNDRDLRMGMKLVKTIFLEVLFLITQNSSLKLKK